MYTAPLTVLGSRKLATSKVEYSSFGGTRAEQERISTLLDWGKVGGKEGSWKEGDGKREERDGKRKEGDGKRKEGDGKRKERDGKRRRQMREGEK